MLSQLASMRLPSNSRIAFCDMTKPELQTEERCGHKRANIRMTLTWERAPSKMDKICNLSRTDRPRLRECLRPAGREGGRCALEQELAGQTPPEKFSEVRDASVCEDGATKSRRTMRCHQALGTSRRASPLVPCSPTAPQHRLDRLAPAPSAEHVVTRH